MFITYYADVDGDGFMDIILVGNDYGMEILQGHADAFNGLVLKNFGKNDFRPMGIQESGFYVPHDAKALSYLILNDQKALILATQNKDSLRVFSPTQVKGEWIKCLPTECRADIYFNSGKIERRELYWGHSYLSQHTRSLQKLPSMVKIIFYDSKGKVTRTIDIGNYQFHHDFRYDKKHDKIICLVNNLDKDTIEDTIVQVDVKTGKTSMLFDCEKILPLMRKLAIQRKGGRNTYGGTELDWIHINSFDFLDDGNSLVLSSREQSSILKIKNIYTKPELDYVIHRGTIYNGTDIAKYQLKREGDFVANAGQHMITVEYDDSLPEGQYYLYMFNNNYGKATSIPTFDWSMYPNVGNFKSGTSYYSKFLVDEKTRTYKLAQQFSLPYSAIVSSVQHLGGNIPFSSGMSKIFGEYDKDGKLIKSFEYEADKYSYRVMKYEF